MLQELMEIIHTGDEKGNGMLFRLRFPSGFEILGLPTENTYGGGWDLGPTWNYVLLGDNPFLVDTGRVGMGPKLLGMMKSAGFAGEDLDFVMVSHGHEDHDGGLVEIVKSTGARVKAHFIYDRLIRFYPDNAPSAVKKGFPASCWRCFMPESFTSKNCREYHQTRSKLRIEAFRDNNGGFGEGIRVFHIPGHSPDSLALLVGDEAVIVGDTVLPGITPWPSQEDSFLPVGEILGPEYTRAESIYGLTAYIRSLKTLREIGREFPDLIVLPGHRLFHCNEWKEIHLEERVAELIDHHITRCSDILEILKRGPKTIREVAMKHFDESLLKGFGMLMAENEVASHCELLRASGDLITAKVNRFATTGSTNFEAAIQSLAPRPWK